MQAFKVSEGVQLEACRMAKVTRMTVNRWRKKDPNFDRSYQEITSEMLQVLHGVEKSKDLLLVAIIQHDGHISRACQSIGVSRQTHGKWYKQDVEYRDRVDDIIDEMNEGILDDAMAELKKQIAGGDFKAIKLAIDKLGSSRGMVDKKQHEISSPSWMSGDKELDEI